MVFGLKRRTNGDEWSGVISAALGARAKDLIRFLATGERPPLPPFEPGADGWQVIPAARNSGVTVRINQQHYQHHYENRQNKGWAQSMSDVGLDWLDAARTMPPDAIQRLADVIGVRHHFYAKPMAVTGEQWLSFALGAMRAGRPWLTLQRVDTAGEWLGYSLADIIASVFTNPYTVRPNAPDFVEWTTTRRDTIVSIIRPALAEKPQLWSRAALPGSVLLEPLRTDLAAALSSPAKTTRAAARPAADALGFAALEPELRRIALEGSPVSRAAAVAAMVDLAPEAQRPQTVAWLVEHCAQDRAASVRATVAEACAGGSSAEARPADLPVVDTATPVPASFRRFISGAWPAAQNSQKRVDELIVALEGGPAREAGWSMQFVLRKEAPLHDLTTAHRARAVMLGASRWTSGLPSRIGQLVPLPTPLEIQAVAAADGAPASTPHSAVVNALAVARWPWPEPQVAEWASHQLSALLSYLTHQTDEYTFSRPGLFAALATVRPRPEVLTRALLQSGLSGLKVDQPVARRALGADATPLVVEALRSTKVAERSGAASWLRELRDPSTEAALRSAIEREQHDAAKTAMLLALEAMGASLDEYLSPARIAADAVSALKKKNAVPAAMQWLSFDALPTVHWRDGTPVAPEIFRWFAATAVKAKSVEPSPLLRRLADEMRPDEAQRFALALYDSWVAKDLAPRSREECEEAARNSARWQISAATRYPDEPSYARFRGLTLEQGVQLLLPRELAVPAGSATDSKGVLALSAAMGGPDLATRSLAFMKKWRGLRVHQGKAMLGMLAGTELPAAIQVVLTVSQRFRPKGLQDEATALVQQLADRRGWSIDDLADRTVPTGGFDHEGRTVFDYGDRRFVAHLRDDLTVDLMAEVGGKQIKTLPDARQGEDEAEVKAMQADLAVARKEVKATSKLQPERLYMAMCAERRWAADDFRRFLLEHPIMCRLATRLVWLVLNEDEAVRLAFRPLTDGTLLDLDDDEAELADGEVVLVAHDLHVGTELGERWLQHFRDYKVSPLFPQFARPAPPTTGGNLWTEVNGHLISARALRGVTTKLAWQLGPAQDGGIVSWVQKDCAIANLTAIVEVTGVPAYTDDTVTALLSAYFVRRGADGDSTFAVPLSDVPRILALETYGEVLQIAAAGDGFDPDYRKKTSF